MKVIKLGGSLLDDQARRAEVLAAIAAEWNRGEQIVLVHGGGKHIDAALAKQGIAKRTYAGLRITDDATLDVVVGVLAGTVNKALVGELSTFGIRAAGISGADGSTIVATRHEPIDGVDLGHVGRVSKASRRLIVAMLTAGMLPVVSSVAEGPEGTLLNVNADTAACAVAKALGAESLQFITDVAGLLDGEGKLVSTLTATDAHAYLASDVVSGGMKPKLEAALGALAAGVTSIAIGSETGGTCLVAA